MDTEIQNDVNAETGGGGESTKLQLYSDWHSTCSCRVRIALNLKGLDYEYKAVNLIKGEQFSPELLKLNPMGYVPVLVDGDIVISDSFAILMYLEEKYPQNPLLPKDPKLKAINFQKYIEDKVGPNEKVPWGQTHIRKGFAALEKLLKSYAGKYATGDEIYLADLFLVPQIHAAINRFNVDMNEYPLLSRIYEACKEVPAIQNAMPEKQPDTPAEARA
nr:glutathione S-transferase zeta class-like [Ipomoea batatas]